MVYYQANTESPVFPDIQGLLLKTAGLVDVLADAATPLAGKLRMAFVYGSIASGGERNDSDVDLMVVGAISPAELSMPLRHARDLLGNQINPTVYSPTEFVRKRAAKDHFLTGVLGRPRLFVLGNADELGKPAE